MKRHKWLLTLLLAVFLLGGGAFLLWQTGFFSSVGSLEEMRNYIERFAPYSHLFFFLIQLLSVVIAPIPSNVTALAGAVLFGMWPSFLMTWLAVAGGSVLVFWLARVLGQRFVERLVNQRVADKYLEVIRRKRDIFLILVFLFPFFPDDLICILAGLTDIPLHRFFLIVLLTRPWGLLVACALGGSVLTIPVWAMLLLGAAGVAVFDLDDDLDRVGFAGDRDDFADLVDRCIMLFIWEGGRDLAGRIKTGCFLGAEAALYLGFLALDLLRPGSGWALLLKYGAVALCFLAALDRAGTEDGRLVCAALAFTLAADWFLLILDSFYLAGVACFCVVQAIYLLRLHRWGAGLLWPLRVGLTVAALAVAALLRALEPLTAVTLCYFAELACNTVSALRLGRRGRCFGLGLLLFVGCDLCVGLHNLAAFLPVVDTGPLFSFAQVGMWLFYLPSQVLITLSVRKK